MFAAEFEPAENPGLSSGGRRRTPRAPVSLEAHIGKAARTLCKVVDISLQGARLQTYSTLKRGATIWLTLPHIGSVVADVMWADDYVAGCQFHRKLDDKTFALLTENVAV